MARLSWRVLYSFGLRNEVFCNCVSMLTLTWVTTVGGKLALLIGQVKLKEVAGQWLHSGACLSIVVWPRETRSMEHS